MALPTIDERLGLAIAEAMVLLGHLARQKGAVAPSLIADVTNSIDKIRDETATSEDRTKFWISYSALSDLARPATVQSILDAEAGAKQASKGRQSTGVTQAGIAACVTLVLLLFTQIYWLVGSTALRDIDRLRGELIGIEAEIAKIELLKDQDQRNVLLAPLLSRKSDKTFRIRANFRNIDKWLHPTRKSDKNEIWDEVAERESLRMEQRARVIIDALGVYILPLFYGLFGATAQVLRRILQHLEDFSLTPESRTRNALRILLGAVVGPAMGLLIANPSTESLFTSMSPLLVAFVVGYNVEILFATLDRIIRSINAKLNSDRDSPAATASSATLPAGQGVR